MLVCGIVCGGQLPWAVWLLGCGIVSRGHLYCVVWLLVCRIVGRRQMCLVVWLLVLWYFVLGSSVLCCVFVGLRYHG